MTEQPVKGERALKKMAGQALGSPSNSQKDREPEKDPLEEAQQFTKKMAANAIIEGEVEKAKAAVEKAKAEAEEAKAKAERAKSGGDESSKTGFKVTGGVNLGNIDLQQEREQAAADLKRMKQEADDSARAVGQENQQLREQIHNQEMKVLEITLKAQMEQLGEMIKSNAQRGTFMEQYNGMIEMAKTLGFSQPSTGGDLATQIELKKMEFENARELRRLSREEKASDREFQRQLNRDADERESRKEEVARQGKRDDMIAKAPEVIGRAFARGLVESEGSGGDAPRSGKTAYSVEIAPGAGGEMDCPSCNDPIGIGPTARMAVCAKCGSKVQIKRVEGKTAEETEEE